MTFPKNLSANDLKHVQRRLNAFTERCKLKGFPSLRVDGEPGPATRKRIRWVKFFIGYPGAAGKQSTNVDDEFLWRLDHPVTIRRSSKRWAKWDRRRVPRGGRRRVAERARWRANHLFSYIAPGVVRFEGVPVAKVAIRYLLFARKHGWQGRLNSGWRSIVYSISLCLRMCSARFCPGRCAGATTNHVGTTAARFAVDVSDYVNFGRIMARPDAPHPRIFNALGSRDPVHFSPSGR